MLCIHKTKTHVCMPLEISQLLPPSWKCFGTFYLYMKHKSKISMSSSHLNQFGNNQPPAILKTSAKESTRDFLKSKPTRKFLPWLFHVPRFQAKLDRCGYTQQHTLLYISNISRWILMAWRAKLPKLVPVVQFTASSWLFENYLFKTFFFKHWNHCKFNWEQR